MGNPDVKNQNVVATAGIGSVTPTTHFKTSVATDTANTMLTRPVITKSTVGSPKAVSTVRTLLAIRVGDLSMQKTKNRTLHKKMAMCRAFKS